MINDAVRLVQIVVLGAVSFLASVTLAVVIRQINRWILLFGILVAGTVVAIEVYTDRQVEA